MHLAQFIFGIFLARAHDHCGWEVALLCSSSALIREEQHCTALHRIYNSRSNLDAICKLTRVAFLHHKSEGLSLNGTTSRLTEQIHQVEVELPHACVLMNVRCDRASSSKQASCPTIDDQDPQIISTRRATTFWPDTLRP